jgi:hypothetical protein
MEDCYIGSLCGWSLVYTKACASTLVFTSGRRILMLHNHHYLYTSALGRLIRYRHIVMAVLVGASYLFSQWPTATVAAHGAAAPRDLPIVTIHAAEPAAEAGRHAAPLAVVRSGSTSAPLEVLYSVAGTAKPGDDYTALPGKVTIPAGASGATILIAPIDDTAKEGAETVIVSLNLSSRYSVEAPTSATVKIADDDILEQVLSFYVVDSTAAELGLDAGTFTIVRDGTTVAPLTVFYAVGGTATPGLDYAALSGKVIIPAGQASVVLKIAPIDDVMVEAAELIVLSIKPDASYSIGAPASATVTIADNDTVPSGATSYRVYMPALLRGY